MANKKTPKKRTPLRAPEPIDNSARKPRPRKTAGVISNEDVRRRSENIANLIGDTFWLACLILIVYAGMALASFHINDPAWSRSTPDVTEVHNMAGLFGAYFSDVAYYLFGFSAWWMVIATATMLIKVFRPVQQSSDKEYSRGIAGFGLFLLLICSPVVEYAKFINKLDNKLPNGAGGMIGNLLGNKLVMLLGSGGSILLMIALMVLAFSLVAQASWLDLLENMGTRVERLFKWLGNKIFRAKGPQIVELPETLSTRRTIRDAKQIVAEPNEVPVNAMSNRKRTLLQNEPSTPIQTASNNNPHNEPLMVSGNYHKPSLDLLSHSQKQLQPIDDAKLQETADRIEAKLAEFGISVQVVSAKSGPVITRFEIEPAQGVKGSQIVNLAKDLARSLTVQSVRIVETIPGKNTMGIELPNEHRQDVALREILSAHVFEHAQSKLTVALDKDISGSPVVGDLAKMPHLLVAGMTGSGKSVGVNGMIMSILYKANPDEVRFIMIDPKMLELSVYDGIAHLLCPVVTDMREAGQALNWCVAEMEKRYRLLSHLGVRTLASYNDKISEAQSNGKKIPNPFSLTPDNPEPLEKLPLIVVVIDELADLMMTERKAVEQQIARLAQKARAAGIHLIIATQRPSVDVITGLIKANIPTRMAFTVQSKIDSRTILDQMGAEDLLKYGDLLYLQPGNAEPTRLQGAFVSDEEVHEVVSHIKQQAPADYIEGLLTGEAAIEAAGSFNPVAVANSDELFDQAVAFILESRKTSISSLQRQLKIGYNRAANLMDALQNAGIVSAPDVGGGRKILAQKDNL